MDTAAQERILSPLKAKGYNFADYRDLYEYTDMLDQRSYSPAILTTFLPTSATFWTKTKCMRY